MSRCGEALSLLLTNWDSLKETRPSEADFGPFGSSMTYASMDELFYRWAAMLVILDEKGFWRTSPEVGIAEAPLAAQLNDINSLVVGAKAQGVAWLISNRFIEMAHGVQLILSALSRRQASLNKEVAKLLSARSAEEQEEILASASAAREVIALAEDLEDSARGIRAAKGEIVAASADAAAKRERIGILAAESDVSAQAAASNRVAIEKAFTEVEELKRAATQRETDLQTRVSAVNTLVAETETSAKAAYKSVEEALRKVRDQGLAHSFQARSTSLMSERRIWTLIFIGATLVLFLVAVVFVVELSEITYEGLLVQLLRKLGLAAPLVWLGWYSARQVGRISRVQEDYEYKAASALAYQSYKEEAKLGGDPALINKLLDHAITTFGENPVRLYEEHSSEPVTPLQAAIRDLPPEKMAAVLAAIGEQTLKAKSWPLGK